MNSMTEHGRNRRPQHTPTHTEIERATRRYRERGGLIVRLPDEHAVRPGPSVNDSQGRSMNPPVPERRAHPRYTEWSVLGAEFNLLFADCLLDLGGPSTEEERYALTLANLCM